MATIVTRSGKGSPLTNAEVDGNFTNLNTELGTKANTLSLATVATSGAYSDLTGKPTNVSSFANDSGYITGITSGNVTTALGFTPYNATNPAGYITSSALSGYLPLSGGTLTGGVNVQGASFPTSGVGMELLWDGTQSVLQSYNRNIATYQPLRLDGSALQLFTNGTEKARIDTSGNVLINRTSTSGIGKLNVEGGADVTSGNVTIQAGYGIAWRGDQARIMTPEDNAYGALIRWGAGGGCRFFESTAERMRIDGTGSVTVNVDIRAPIFYDQSNTAYYVDPNNTSNINKLTASNRSMVGNASIFMSDLDANTYYPVTIPIPVARQTTLRIENALNSNAPSWSTHPSGFSCYIEWTTNGLGWGTIPISRRVTDWREQFATVQIVGGITQLGNGSTEVIWLRGGANYFFSADCDVTPTVRTTLYDLLGQTVEPRSTVFNDPWETAQGKMSYGTFQANERVTAGTDMRAPIFYDSPNTAFYLDPVGTSNLNQINLGDSTKFIRGGGSGQTILGTGGVNEAYLQVGGSYYSIWNAGNFNPASYLPLTGGTLTGNITLNSGSPSITFTSTTSGRSGTFGMTDAYNMYLNAPTNGVLFLGEFRAPIMRDSDNSAFFIDAADTSNLNNLTLNTGPVYRSDWTTRFQSGSDFVDGTLVTTDIPATASEGESFVIEITGKTYDQNNPPVKVVAQGYLYNNTIINYSGISYAGNFATYIKVFQDGGVLKFWWPRISYWNSFNVNVMAMDGPTNNTITRNRVTAIANSTEPTGTKKQQINLTKTLKTGDAAGSISGFNNPTTAPTANTIAYRDAAGDISAREIVLSSGLSAQTPTVLVSMYPSTNQLVRTTPAAVAASIQGAASGSWGISVTGNAATATKSTDLNQARYVNNDFNTLGTSPQVFRAYSNYIPSGGSYNQPVAGGNDFKVLQWGDVEGGTSGNWGGQIVQNFYDDRMWFRRSYGTTWQAWREFIHDGNVGSFAMRTNASATNSVDVRAPIFYDTPDTSWFLDPSSTSVLNVVRANAIEHVNGTDAIQLTDGSYLYFRSPDNGIRMYLGGADPANYYDNTTHYFRDRASTILAKISNGDGILVGPNTSGQYTRLGGNGGGADVCTVSASNGNLHVDAKTGNNLYLSWYNVATTYVGGEIAATVFRDRDNAAYFIDPTATQSIRTVGDWRSDSSDWTGEFNGKIQYHANNWYFQAANEWIFRRSDGQSAMWVTQTGAASFFGGIPTINNISPPNGAIRLTPNLHLNAGSGSAVILNWDNGTTSGNTLRIGNGAGSDIFTVSAGGNATSYSYQGNGNVGGTGSASWHPSGIYSAGYNWLYGGISAGGSDISSVNNYYGNAYYDSGDTSTYINPNGVSWIKGDINISRVATGGDNNTFGGLELREVSLVGSAQSAATYAPRLNFHWGARAAATIYMDSAGSFVFGGQSDITNNRRSIFCNELYATGNVTAYYSDDRLKTRIGNIENALDIVSSLNGFRYVDNELAETFGYANNGTQLGVSAQEVQKHLPEIVRGAAFDVDHDNPDHGSKTGENYLTVDYSRMVPLLIEAIKELRHEVEMLKK